MASGALILPSYYEAIRDLPDGDRLVMYDSIIKYGLYGEVCELPPHLRGYFTLIRPSMDSSRKRYDAAQRNGERGGRPRKNQRQNQSENQTRNQRHNQDLDKDRDSDKDSDKDMESIADKPHRSRFVPPTVEEVAEYCRERRNGVDAQTFVDHYEANGWMRGKNKVKDWKACVRVWEGKSPDGKAYDYRKGDDSL